MSIEELLKSININKSGEYNDNNNYIISLLDSKEYGRVFSTLEKSDAVDIMEDNQVITEQGSSLMYEAIEEPYILNLLADFDNSIYQLVITNIEE